MGHQMNAGRHIVGIGLILISALLFLVDHAVIVCLQFEVSEWSVPPGRLATSAATHSSPLLNNLSTTALFFGIAYLIAAEVPGLRQRRQKRDE